MSAGCSYRISPSPRDRWPGDQIVVSFGGGVNSTAMLVGMHERGIRPDHILFADTGGEMPATYSHVWRVSSWLESVGFPSITVVVASRIYPTLEAECLGRKALPSLAFGFRKCSDQYKIQPQEQFCKVYNHYVKAIGIDFGEQHRAQKNLTSKTWVKWFPLIEWQWTRAACVDAIQRAGICVPPKSSCFFCPASKKAEVLSLAKDHPDLFARAVAMEDNAAESLRVIKGLGRHWSWKELARLDAAQLRLVPDPPSIPCTCSDGDDDE